MQIKYLPKDMDYTVTEKGYTPDGYTTTFKDDSGNIIADDVVTAAFVNYRNRKKESVGSLHISKTVAGNDGDKDKGFTFKVEFDKGSFYHFSGVGIPGGTIKSGDTFTLSHGQSITITGLPEGTEYKVTENDYRDEGYETSATNYKGTIIKDSIISAKFTNTKDVEDPEDPDKPGDPDDPNKPGDKPGEDDDSGILGEGDEKTPGGSNLPKTGDPSLLLLWFLTMAGALFGIYWLSRKKPLFTRK